MYQNKIAICVLSGRTV